MCNPDSAFANDYGEEDHGDLSMVLSAGRHAWDEDTSNPEEICSSRKTLEQVGSEIKQQSDAQISRSGRRTRKKFKHYYQDSLETKNGFKRTSVHHNYHDFARHDLTEDFCVEKDTPKRRSGTNTPFPVVLHNILEQAEIFGFADVISWQSHGRAFHVHNPQKFTQTIIPKYFRQTRFTSFQRQLSLYGFLRLTRKGQDQNAYYNERFLRGMPELAATIHRFRIKGHGVRQASSPDTEPGFFSMPTVEESQQERADATDKTNPLALELKQMVSSIRLPLVEAMGMYHTSDEPAKVKPPRQPSFSDLNLNTTPAPCGGGKAALNMTPKEQDEMADFLFDVDLGEDDSESIESRIGQLHENMVTNFTEL